MKSRVSSPLPSSPPTISQEFRSKNLVGTSSCVYLAGSQKIFVFMYPFPNFLSNGSANRPEVAWGGVRTSSLETIQHCLGDALRQRKALCEQYCSVLHRRNLRNHLLLSRLCSGSFEGPKRDSAPHKLWFTPGGPV